jgi:hypothetical protein
MLSINLKLLKNQRKISIKPMLILKNKILSTSLFIPNLPKLMVWLKDLTEPSKKSLLTEMMRSTLI